MKTSIFPTSTLLIISLLMIGCNNAQVGDHDKNNQPVTKNQIDLASKDKKDNYSPANNIKNTNATSKARINNKNNITKDNENEIKKSLNKYIKFKNPFKIEKKCVGLVGLNEKEKRFLIDKIKPIVNVIDFELIFDGKRDGFRVKNWKENRGAAGGGPPIVFQRE